MYEFSKMSLKRLFEDLSDEQMDDVPTQSSPLSRRPKLSHARDAGTFGLPFNTKTPLAPVQGGEIVAVSNSDSHNLPFHPKIPSAEPSVKTPPQHVPNISQVSFLKAYPDLLEKLSSGTILLPTHPRHQRFLHMDPDNLPQPLPQYRGLEFDKLVNKGYINFTEDVDYMRKKMKLRDLNRDEVSFPQLLKFDRMKGLIERLC